jgi:hypothetical protein
MTLDFASIMNQPISWIQPKSRDLIDYYIWRNIVKFYAGCELSFQEKDKLVAIAGITESICQDDKYLSQYLLLVVFTPIKRASDYREPL